MKVKVLYVHAQAGVPQRVYWTTFLTEFGWKRWFSGLQSFLIASARVETNCQLLLAIGICLTLDPHIIQFLQRFEEYWTTFHEVMTENDHFWTCHFSRTFDKQYNFYLCFLDKLWKIIYEIWKSTLMCSSCENFSQIFILLKHHDLQF